MRNEFSNKVKLAAWARAAGKCERCGGLLAGKFEYDHDKPCTFAGEATEANCRVLCRSCHVVKTVAEDMPAIRKSNRVRYRHANIRSERKILAWRNFAGEIVRKGRDR